MSERERSSSRTYDQNGDGFIEQKRSHQRQQRTGRKSRNDVVDRSGLRGLSGRAGSTLRDLAHGSIHDA